jgi:hypothetical protein
MNKTEHVQSRVCGVWRSLILIFFSLTCLPATGYAIESTPANDELVLHAEQWEAARAGESLLALPVLQHLVNAWAAHPHQRIEMRYPGGEDGELWVAELKDWLVSLGIASKYMTAVPGSGEADAIRFQIIQTGD